MSLDHRSFYFRQTDKKEITTKVLIDTIKDLAAKHAADHPHAKGRFDQGDPQFRFAFANRVVHKQVLRLLLVAGKRQFARGEMVGLGNARDVQKRFHALLQDLVISFFRLTPNFIASAEIVRAGGPAERQENSGVQYAVGTRVDTPQGVGVVARFDAESKLYTVTLPDRQVEIPRGEILVHPKSETPASSDETDLPDETLAPASASGVDAGSASASVSVSASALASASVSASASASVKKAEDSEELGDEAPVQIESDGGFGGSD